MSQDQLSQELINRPLSQTPKAIWARQYYNRPEIRDRQRQYYEGYCKTQKVKDKLKLRQLDENYKAKQRDYAEKRKIARAEIAKLERELKQNPALSRCVGCLKIVSQKCKKKTVDLWRLNNDS